MAQVEAPFVTAFFIFLFVGIVFWRACAIIARQVEQANYERQRMFLMVAEELDRLDKALKEAEQTKQAQEVITPYKDLWHLRN